MRDSAWTSHNGETSLSLHQGHVLDVLREMPAESVHCVVTSPPYWGLRDYNLEPQVWDGEEGCAWRGSLGLEPTPDLYVQHLVEAFKEVRRVLRKDGTLFLNLGDSYFSGSNARPYSTSDTALRDSLGTEYLKPKDLVGMPWRVAFALQEPYYTGVIKDERDRTWLAALVDGEGTFTILSTTSPHGSGNSYPPIAQVRMTSRGVVQRAASMVGVASPAQYPPSATGNRAVYQWRLSGRRAADIARELYPYLIGKRKQAMAVWNHQVVRDSYTTKRAVTIPVAALEKQQTCRDIIRRLNRGARVDLPSWMVEPPSLYEPGWYLRSDVIWSKPNPMPESVTDRPTKAHEYLFLLAKDERYFYDADAIREPSQGPEPWGARAPDGKAERDESQGRHGASSIFKGMTREEKMRWYGNGRNRRTVWEIATEPFPNAHFATFPTELVKPCILAGTSEKGVCPECGAPWEREVAAEGGSIGKSWHNHEHDLVVGQRQEAWVDFSAYRRQTTGWHPTCAHDKDPIPATVLDPFAGSGTTLLVATRLGRNGVGVELSPAYVQLAIKRLGEHKQQRLVLP